MTNNRQLPNLFDFLPDDLVHRVFQSFFAEIVNPANVRNIAPAVALSLTCSRFWMIFKTHASKIRHLHLTDTAVATYHQRDPLDDGQSTSLIRIATPLFNENILLYMLRNGRPEHVQSLLLPVMSRRLSTKMCTMALGPETKKSSLNHFHMPCLPNTVFTRLMNDNVSLRSLTVTPRSDQDLENLKFYLHRHGTALQSLTVRTGIMDEADVTFRGEPSCTDASYVRDRSVAGIVSQILLGSLSELQYLQVLTIDSRGTAFFERFAIVDHAYPIMHPAQAHKPSIVLLGDDDYWFAWHPLCYSALSQGFNIFHRGMGCTYMIPEGSCFPETISRYNRDLVADLVLLVTDLEDATEDTVQFVPMHCRETYGKCEVIDISTFAPYQMMTPAAVTFVEQIVGAATPCLHSLIIKEAHPCTLQLFRYALCIAEVQTVHFYLNVFLYYMHNIQMTTLKRVSLWFSEESDKDIGTVFSILVAIFTNVASSMPNLRKIELFGFEKLNTAVHIDPYTHRCSVRELWNTVNEFDHHHPQVDVESVLVVVGHWKEIVDE